jgi:hypothetical protein
VAGAKVFRVAEVEFCIPPLPAAIPVLFRHFTACTGTIACSINSYTEIIHKNGSSIVGYDKDYIKHSFGFSFISEQYNGSIYLKLRKADNADSTPDWQVLYDADDLVVYDRKSDETGEGAGSNLSTNNIDGAERRISIENIRAYSESYGAAYTSTNLYGTVTSN